MRWSGNALLRRRAEESKSSSSISRKIAEIEAEQNSEERLQNLILCNTFEVGHGGELSTKLRSCWASCLSSKAISSNARVNLKSSYLLLARATGRTDPIHGFVSWNWILLLCLSLNDSLAGGMNVCRVQFVVKMKAADYDQEGVDKSLAFYVVKSLYRRCHLKCLEK